MTVAATFRQILKFHEEKGFAPRDYWEERHHAHLGSLKSVGHRMLTDEQNADQYALKRERITDLIGRCVGDGRGRSLLDAGCGIGMLTSAYIDLGFAVTGVDFSETAIREARATEVEADFVVSPLVLLDLGRRFDVITAIDVLLHVVNRREWSATIAALSRHLKPGGFLVVLDFFPDDDEGWPDHVRPRPLADYKAAFDRLNLRISEHEQFDLPYEDVTKDLIAVRSHDGSL